MDSQAEASESMSRGLRGQARTHEMNLVIINIYMAFKQTITWMKSLKGEEE